MRTSVLSVLLATWLGCAASPAPGPAPLPVAPASAAPSESPPAPAIVAGGPCVTEGKEKCLSATEALACHDGRWERMSCRDREGCTKADEEDVCHQSAVQESEVCNLASDFACRSDDRALMTCTKNRWVLASTCFGERRCSIEGKKVTCDNSLASLGDACREADDYACATSDGKTALACRQGKFVVAASCKGPKGCRVTGDKASGFKVECDDSVATEGDSCDKAGHYSCAADGKRILVCKDGRFTGDDKCKGREKCAVKNGLVGCYP